MFSWLKKKTDLETFVIQLHKKENYTVDYAMLCKVFALVKKYPIDSEEILKIRNSSLGMYRSRRDLYDCLALCSQWIAAERALKENINHGVSTREVHFDTWLVSDDAFRIDYYVFIEEFSQLIEDYLLLLSQCKEEMSRVAFASLEYGLYTLHYDILTLAENHLSFVYENQPH